MLVTDVHQQRSLTRITPVDGATAADLDAVFAAMETDALQDLVQEQIPREHLQTVRHAGMRYRGQSYEVAVLVPNLQGPHDLDDLVKRFHDAHQRRYGHMAQAEAVEIVNFQVTAIGRIPKPETKRFDPAARGPGSGRADRRAGGHRGADVDHRALSGTARACRRLPEHRGRDAILTTSPAGCSDPNSDARGDGGGRE
jgi:N-methylhydantoinase A